MTLVAALLLGALGNSLKPVPFLSAIVPGLTALVVVVALWNDLPWYAASGLFYAGLATAELAYLGTLFARHAAARPARPMVWWQRRRSQKA